MTRYTSDMEVLKEENRFLRLKLTQAEAKILEQQQELTMLYERFQVEYYG